MTSRSTGASKAARAKATQPAPPTQPILVQIRALMPSLAPSERRVAEAALADPGAVAALTIGQLAEQCATSETTVIRFCRAIGLRGYPDLRIGLASAAGTASGAGWSGVGSDIGAGDALADVVRKLGFADARAVEDTVAQLDLDVLRKVIDAIVAANHIDLYGVGASAFIAFDLEQKLHRIGRPVHAWPDPQIALTSAALRKRKDVAIGVSHTGTTVDVVASLGEARSNGAVTVAITNFSRSPIAEVADLVLTTAVRETTFRSGAMASRIAALAVVDCIFVGVAQRDYTETLRALERTRDAVQRAAPKRR
ncbi:MAG TPA: MurR/RpiR family transcriptional regulator [Micromonosporaceae bacterium]|jgi:DNA-binding MurR/RpiR family transcriptional regulator